MCDQIRLCDAHLMNSDFITFRFLPHITRGKSFLRMICLATGTEQPINSATSFVPINCIIAFSFSLIKLLFNQSAPLSRTLISLFLILFIVIYSIIKIFDESLVIHIFVNMLAEFFNGEIDLFDLI